MEKIKYKISVKICKANNEVVVSTVLPTSAIIDIDVAAIFSYLASRYDVFYFCTSICDAGLDRSVTFRLKDSFFDAKRFSHFLLSL